MNQLPSEITPRLGFFGGSFDPIHEGHINLIQLLLGHSHWSSLYVVPAWRNPHKMYSPESPAPLRLEMLRTSLQALCDPRVKILEWEIFRQEPSYTLTTIENLSKETSTPICLILGNEVFQSIHRWHGAQTLLKRVDVLVIERDSSLVFAPQVLLKTLGILDPEPCEGNDKKLWHSSHTRSVECVQLPVLPYSSTSLRKQICKKWERNDMEHPPRGIQRLVWQIIKENQLYTVTKNET